MFKKNLIFWSDQLIWLEKLNVTKCYSWSGQLIWSANQLIFSDQLILFDQDTWSDQLIWLEKLNVTQIVKRSEEEEEKKRPSLHL